jgi:hypothetical protein
MSLWAHLSHSFWVEEAPPAAPAPSSSEATGAPAFLRGAVRFVIVGCTAIVLTAQMASIRLAAPVDADPSYCITQQQSCYLACPSGPGNADCIRSCDLQEEQCRVDNG